MKICYRTCYLTQATGGQKKVVEIGRAICYVRSTIVHKFFDNSNHSTPINGFDRPDRSARFRKPYQTLHLLRKTPGGSFAQCASSEENRILRRQRRQCKTR
jgi:hypothetical protein